MKSKIYLMVKHLNDNEDYFRRFESDPHDGMRLSFERSIRKELHGCIRFKPYKMISSPIYRIVEIGIVELIKLDIKRNNHENKIRYTNDTLHNKE